MGVTLTKSSSAGDVNSLTVSKPSECDLSGALGTICGTHGLSKVEKTGTWSFAADEEDITLSSIDVHYVFAGCAVPSLRVKGSSTLSVDKASAISTTTFGGEQTLYNALGEELGKSKLEGALSMSPAATYGLKTAPTVETKWTDGNEHLSKDGQLTLTGAFSFSGSSGSVSCPATIKLALESSTVEEEEAEGEIESFTVSKPSECDVGGTLGTQCGTHSLASVEQTGTATLNATETDFTISGLSLDYKFSACVVTSLRVDGSPTVSLDDPSAIGEVTFGGGALQIYNASGEKTGSAEVGGSAAASPAGTYQVAEGGGGGDQWHTDPGEVLIGGASEADHVTLAGNLTFTQGGLSFGPCATAATVELWNEGGVATGEPISVEIAAGAGCVVSVEGSPVCNIEGFKIGAGHLNTSGTAIDLENVFILQHFNEGCPIGEEAGAAGTLTGTWAEGGHCIVFNNSGDLGNPNGPFTVDGELCNSSLTLH
jgi:hypothetical protein